MGRGDAAGPEAGRVRHALRLYRLIPRSSETRRRPPLAHRRRDRTTASRDEAQPFLCPREAGEVPPKAG